MGTIERKQRRREEVHDAILKAAWKLVIEEGWQGLSLRKIAGAIEYSVPVVYDHFENKEAILAVFTRKGFGLLSREIREWSSGELSPVQRIQAVADSYWLFAIKHPEYYQLMYGLGMPGCDKVNEMQELQDFTDLLQSTIKAACSLPLSRSELMVKVNGLWSLLHGHVSIRIMENSDGKLAKDALDRSIQDFITGIQNTHK